MTAAPKKYPGSLFLVTVFYSVMVLISLLFIVIPVMSVDVSCAAATQEIFVCSQRIGRVPSCAGGACRNFL